MLALYLAQIVNSGLALGSVYGLMALGFALIFNSSRLLNFAQGELLLVGGLGLYSLCQIVTPSPLVGLLASASWGLLLGVFLYCTTLGVSLAADGLKQFILTVAASLVWQGAAILAWGKKPLMLPLLLPVPAVSLGAVYLSPETAAALVLALGSGFVLTLFLKYSRQGRAIRAVSQNAQAARLQGVNPQLAYALAFALAGGLAALAGMAIGPQTMLRHDMGLGLGLKGFVAATIGGYASLWKVFLGGIGLGLLEASLTLLLSAELKEALTFGLLILLLVAVPPPHKEGRLA
jgi:branched-chain amino acid transport system permease protein